MEEISRFICNNAWSIVALLPAIILLVLAGALRGTKIVKEKPYAPLALVVSLMDTNCDPSWNLRN